LIQIIGTFYYQSGRKSAQKSEFAEVLEKNISRLANVLYGATLNLNTEFIFNKVTELVQNKQQNINLMKGQIRIVQTNISKTNDTLQHIIQHE